jgi:hypothetical protein
LHKAFDPTPGVIPFGRRSLFNDPTNFKIGTPAVVISIAGGDRDVRSDCCRCTICLRVVYYKYAARIRELRLCLVGLAAAEPAHGTAARR